MHCPRVSGSQCCERACGSVLLKMNMTQHHIPECWNPRSHCCEQLNTHTAVNSSTLTKYFLLGSYLSLSYLNSLPFMDTWLITRFSRPSKLVLICCSFSVTGLILWFGTNSLFDNCNVCMWCHWERQWATEQDFVMQLVTCEFKLLCLLRCLLGWPTRVKMCGGYQ